MNRFLFALCVLFLLASSSVLAAEKKPVPSSETQDLNLVNAQCMALKENPSMAVAMERVEQARARVEQAVANWYPSLDLAFGGGHQHLSDTTYKQNKAISEFLGTSLDQNNMEYNSSLQATWVLFDGFYRSFNEKKAKLGQEAEENGQNDSKRLLAASVAQAFLNAQLAQTNIDIAQANVQFYNDQLKNAQNRYDVGAGPWGDVLNIKVQRNSAQSSLMQYQRELEAAEYGLAALLGLPNASLPADMRLAPLGNKLPEKEVTNDAQETIAKAYALRPDVRRLEKMIAASESALGMAKAHMYPTITAKGSLAGERENSLPAQDEYYGNTISLNMSWNLYSGGADKARMVEAQHAQREASYNLASLRNSVAAEIRQDFALLAAAKEQVQLQQQSVELVKENRQLAQNAYEAGEAPLIQLNEAQKDLNTTASRLAQALVAYQRAQQQLLEASGRNLEPVYKETPCRQE